MEKEKILFHLLLTDILCKSHHDKSIYASILYTLSLVLEENQNYVSNLLWLCFLFTQNR